MAMIITTTSTPRNYNIKNQTNNLYLNNSNANANNTITNII